MRSRDKVEETSATRALRCPSCLCVASSATFLMVLSGYFTSWNWYGETAGGSR